jgi:cytochrome b6-f complex iron-sulfur subunit
MKILATTLALLVASAQAFAPQPLSRSSSALSATRAVSEEFYIDEERRFVMNLAVVAANGVVIAGLGVPFIAFLVPPGSGGGSGGTTAKDAKGFDLIAKDYLASKQAGDRSLAEGLKGDAT